MEGDFLNTKCELIELALQNLSLKSLNPAFKSAFLVKNDVEYVCVVNSQRLFCSRNLILNVKIKAFWHTNVIKMLKLFSYHLNEYIITE